MNLQLIYFGLLLALGTLLYLTLSPRQRRLARNRSRSFRSEKDLSASRSDISDASKESLDAAAVQQNCYSSTFPPSQRHTLSIIAQKLTQKQVDSLGGMHFDLETFRGSLVGWEEDYSVCDQSKYIASGFKIQEVKALGDFPDYSILSGVPRPQPYETFDIRTARPRPYRPFRWPYHQTMCKCWV